MEVKSEGLQEFKIPDEPHEDIFSLYFSVPKREEEERRKREEEERKKQEEERVRKEQEDRRKATEAAELAKQQLAKRGKAAFSEPMPKRNLPEAELKEILDKYSDSDREILQSCLKSMRDKGKMSVFLMEELKAIALCQAPPSTSVYNEQVIDRPYEVKDSFASFKSNKKYGGGGGYNKRDSKYDRDRDRDRDRRDGRGYDKKRQSERGGFVRKELTEDEKRMKEEAAHLKDKLEQRNKLTNEIELRIKMTMNKITPSNYNKCKKELETLIAEQDYNESILNLIGQTIFNKACVEKKYTSMYSELCTQMVKSECKHLADIEEQKGDSERIEEAKKIYESKLAKIKLEIEKGNLEKIPKDMRQFEPKILKGKKLISVLKKQSSIRNSILEKCRKHIEQLNEEFEVDKTDPDWEEKLAKHREKVIGNVRFIGSLFNADFMSLNLLTSIFKEYLTKHPKEMLDKDQPLSSVALDLLEACCILCESTGKKIEETFDTS